MHPYIIEMFEPAVVLGTLLGLAFGVKILIWGKGPIKRIRNPEQHPELEHRIAELEEQWQQVSEVLVEQSNRLEDHDERLDFAERILTRKRAEEPPALQRPEG